MVSDFPYNKELPSKKEFAPSERKFFPSREVSILNRDIIEENHCLIR